MKMTDYDKGWQHGRDSLKKELRKKVIQFFKEQKAIQDSECPDILLEEILELLEE